MNAHGDADNDQDVDGDDLAVWEAQFGLAGAAIDAASTHHRHRWQSRS